MSDLPDRLAELQELLGALRDGIISPAQMVRLDHLLTTEPEARRYYAAYMDLVASLHRCDWCAALQPGYEATESRGEEAGRGPVRRLSPDARPAPRPGGGHSGRVRRFLVAATVVLSLMLGGLYLWQREGPPAPPGEEQAEPLGEKGVAMLTRSVGAQWEPTDLPTTPGSPLPTGRLVLKAGLAQIEFYGGATVILEGPADFELLGTARASCRYGKLRVRASPRAQKFSVATPVGDVVDLGTEFGIQVEKDGQSEVHVFDGKVQLHRNASGGAPPGQQELVSGQGVRINPAGVAQATEANPDAFVGEEKLDRRSFQEAQNRYRAWREASRSRCADPRTLLYFSFEDQQSWERTLRNQAADQVKELDGAIVGCQWAEGRWPGKGALEFKRLGDRVRLSVPGEYSALTLAAWVRVDGYDRPFVSLLMSDYLIPGKGIYWQLDATGQLRFNAGNEFRHLSPALLSPEKFGQWVHLAVVCDAHARTVTHYLDGRAVSSQEIPSGVRLTIGGSEIGNWCGPSPHRLSIRNLNGRMDEFVLFKEALPAEEIQALYEIGKPGS